mgnify:CR=1 FL=1
MIRKLYLVLFILGLLVSPQQVKAKAVKDKRYICNEFYSDVDKIFFAYEEKLPFSEIVDWDYVVQTIMNKYKPYLEEENISFEYTTKSREEIHAEHKQALYFKQSYSFADKSAFSLSLGTDQMITWLTVYSYNTSEGSGFIIGPLSKDTIDPKMRLAGSNQRSWENNICGVLEFTAKKKCVNKPYNRIQLEPVTEQCIAKEKDTVFEDYLEFLQKKENNENAN